MPAGLAGVILGGIFAASMSTASSMLLAASTLFVNDIYEPLLEKRMGIGEEKRLLVIRAVTLLVCVSSVTVSLFMDNIVNVMYLGGLFYSTAVFFPLVIGLKWKRATASGALCSILASVLVGCLAEFSSLSFFGWPSNVVSAGTGLLVFVIVSLLTKAPGKEQVDFSRW